MSAFFYQALEFLECSLCLCIHGLLLFLLLICFSSMVTTWFIILYEPDCLWIVKRKSWLCCCVTGKWRNIFSYLQILLNFQQLHLCRDAMQHVLLLSNLCAIINTFPTSRCRRLPPPLSAGFAPTDIDWPLRQLVRMPWLDWCRCSFSSVICSLLRVLEFKPSIPPNLLRTYVLRRRVPSLIGLFSRNFDQGFSRVYLMLVHSCMSCRNGI